MLPNKLILIALVFPVHLSCSVCPCSIVCVVEGCLLEV